METAEESSRQQASQRGGRDGAHQLELAPKQQLFSFVSAEQTGRCSSRDGCGDGAGDLLHGRLERVEGKVTLCTPREEPLRHLHWTGVETPRFWAEEKHGEEQQQPREIPGSRRMLL